MVKQKSDTSPSAASEFCRRIMAKSPEERLIMGCSMFDAARQIVRESLLNQKPRMTPREMREKLFFRFYGAEFTKARRNAISVIFRM